MTTNHHRALVLFSGGQDSATCLAWALDRFDYVETVGFEYGQRHVVEMACREQVRQRLRVVDGATTKLLAELAADGIARSNVPARLVMLGKAGLPVPPELVDLAAIRTSATMPAPANAPTPALKQASA